MTFNKIAQIYKISLNKTSKMIIFFYTTKRKFCPKFFGFIVYKLNFQKIFGFVVYKLNFQNKSSAVN